MPHWYYAQDDHQHGPLSEQDLKALIASGEISANHDVWRDGMADWQPAGTLPELFAERPVTPPPMPAAQRRGGGFSPRMFLRWLDADLMQLARPLGQWLLIGGFLLVIASKGCDAVSQRYAERVKSQAALASDEFNYEYDLRQARLELERDDINAQAELTERDHARLEKIDELLVELQEDRAKEQTRLRRTTWQRLQHAADTADANRRQSALWYTILFTFGTMVLTIGLLIVGLTGQGAQSWLCLGILGIIAFSLFVGGAAWIGRFLP